MSTTFVTPDTAAHYYTRSGEPLHQVPKKSGEGFRDTNVTDARALGLLPSVSTVIRILDKPQLVAWKINNALLASLTLPRGPGETDQDFAVRCATDAERTAEEAADFGHIFHSAAEAHLTGREPVLTDAVRPAFLHWRTWAQANVEDVIATEKIVVGENYAGCADALLRLKTIGRCLMDFKTRTPYKVETKSRGVEWKLRSYDEDAMQLGAYRQALKVDYPTISCLVSSSTTIPPFMLVHQWEEEEAVRGTAIFNKLLDCWCLLKNYRPTQS